jgi:polar amino acid transport system substrate-binding protein
VFLSVIGKGLLQQRLPYIQMQPFFLPGMTMKKYIVSITCLLLLIAISAMAEEKKVVLGSSEYPPFFGKNLPDQGVLTEITVEAFKKMGYQVEVRFLPFARVLSHGKQGTIDGIIVLWHTKEREQWFAFSDPLPSNLIGFYKRKDKSINFTTYADLMSYRIGVVRGYANPAGFDEAKLQTLEVTFDLQNLQKLQKGRIDLAIIDKWVAQYLIQTEFAEFAAELEWIEPPLETKPQYITFSKKAPGYEQKLLDFNQGLKQLIEEGGVKAILAKHGFKE